MGVYIVGSIPTRLANPQNPIKSPFETIYPLIYYFCDKILSKGIFTELILTLLNFWRERLVEVRQIYQKFCYNFGWFDER